LMCLKIMRLVESTKIRNAEDRAQTDILKELVTILEI
jgi:hypothetical protein